MMQLLLVLILIVMVGILWELHALRKGMLLTVIAMREVADRSPSVDC